MWIAAPLSLRMNRYIMKCMSTIFLCVCLTTISVAAAQCSAKTALLNGKLIVTDKDMDGFPIELGMPEDPEDLPYVLLDCEAGSEVTISISKPMRTDDGGPKLAGPLNSYFYYQDKAYDQKKTLTLNGGFEDLPIRVRLSLSNDDNILLASDDYHYTTSLIVATTVSESATGNETINPTELLLSLESKLFEFQAGE